MPSRAGPFQGEVYAIDPQINQATRSVPALARIPNEDRRLRPGLFANVTLSVDRREGALLVPEEAVFSQGGERYVYRVADGKALLVPDRPRSAQERDGGNHQGTGARRYRRDGRISEAA